MEGESCVVYHVLRVKKGPEEAAGFNAFNGGWWMRWGPRWGDNVRRK